jgi:TonB family protein
MPETPSLEPAGESAGEPASASDAVIATEPIESAELELPITSQRQPVPADEAVLDLSPPQVAISADSQSPETYLAGYELEPEQDVVESREGALQPREDVLGPREDVTEPQEGVVEEPALEAQEGVPEPEEHVVEPEQDVLETREEVLESRESVSEPKEDVLQPSAEPLLTDEEETLTRSHPTPAVEPPRDTTADHPAIAVPESKTEPVAHKPATDRSRSAYSASLLGLSATTSHESETVVNLKRCPRCHRTFQNTQLSYCPRDYGTLISIDDLNPVPPPSQVSTPAVLWVLVAFVLGVSGFGAYKLAGYILRKETPSIPTAAKPAEKPPEVKKPNFMVGGTLAGLEVVVPEPVYPAGLHNSGIAGTITVRIRVNKKGRVISAVSSKGDPRLRAAAVKAATQATFSPEKLEQVDSRTGVVSGTITYEFPATPAGPSTQSTATGSPSTGVESGAPGPTTTSPADASTNADPNAPVVSESLAGAALKIPTAEYPKRAKAAGIGGTIIVTVRVNRTGKVVSWRTSTGDSQLRSAALNAARKATFSPGKLPGDGDVLGTITYKFTNSSSQ